MTHQELEAVVVIFKGYFFAAMFYLLLIVVDGAIERPSLKRFFHPITTWYSRALFTIYSITFVFILCLLWETKKY